MDFLRWLGVLCLVGGCGDDSGGPGNDDTGSTTGTAGTESVTMPTAGMSMGTSIGPGTTTDDTESTGMPTTDDSTTSTGGEESGSTTTGGMGMWDEDYPSCEDLAGDDCGGDNCCATDAVPGGWFAMGRGQDLPCSGTPEDGEDCTATSLTCNEGTVIWGCPEGSWIDLGSFDGNGSGDDDEFPEHAARADFYGLDRYEVTVGRMRAFVGAYDKATLLTALGGGAGAHPDIGGTEWDGAWDDELPDDADLLRADLACDAVATWTDAAGGNETYPINCVSWYLAYAFCAWDEGRLPTAAEWERASIGGEENRRYPWGNDAPTEDHANYLVSDNTPEVDVFAKPIGAARWGHHSIGGSMWEWVYDTYEADWYTGAGADCDNCVNLGTGDKAMRGGDFQFSAPHMRGANRFSGIAGDDWLGAGIRCARD